MSISNQIQNYVDKTQPKKEFDALVFVGRFQPFHNGHKAIIDAALQRAKEVIVVVGSSFAARSIRNPFTFQERKEMIKAVFPQDNVKVVPVSDYPYDDSKWVAAVQAIVYSTLSYTPDSIKIGLIGHEKDGTSFYLKIFPTWGSVSVPNVDGINATFIREKVLAYKWPYETFSRLMPKEALRVMELAVYADEYGTPSDAFNMLFVEYPMIQKYKEAWKAAPFPPTFMTVDAVVVQSGHILLVKRGDMPGKGLWALPGGFLNQEETMLDGAIRELKEETKIKVPVPVLKGSIRDSKTFDAPHRSARGRTITQAFYIDLGVGPLPKVKQYRNIKDTEDDAEESKWVPLSKVKQEDMFEDHYHIIHTFIPL
jgi:bifunctional NMN adenylyltransferase/nudix hydrolase